MHLIRKIKLKAKYQQAKVSMNPNSNKDVRVEFDLVK